MRDAPAFHRNKQPMLDVLIDIFGSETTNVLEIASGSGQHGPFFTEHMENLTWWPSDIDADAIESINDWRKELKADRVQNPQYVDVTDTPWRRGISFPHWPMQFDAILSMNMIHIAPPEAMTGLFEGAKYRLSSTRKLIFYGPFKLNGKHTSLSNENFDQYLQNQNNQWGVRNLDDLELIADKNGFTYTSRLQLPANNFAVIFTRT